MNLHGYHMLPAPMAHRPVRRRHSHHPNNWRGEWEHQRDAGRFPSLTPRQRQIANSRRAWQRGWAGGNPFINPPTR